MLNIVPKKFHALTRITKHVLNLTSDVTFNDVSKLKLIIEDHLNNGLSPKDIQKLYNIEYSDFGMFIKSSLNIKLKSVKEAVNNHYKMSGRSLTDEKEIYKKKCQFNFDPYSYKNIKGYDLLLKFGMYHPTKNPNGVCRDHIVSREYGFRNNIDPAIIAHPANCQFLTNADNIKKGEKSLLNADQLLERIGQWEQGIDVTFVTNDYINLPKTLSHKQKISETNKKFMFITDGNINKRVLKTSTIPFGFRRGLTKKW